MISAICSTFGCTPDVAERQDWQLCQAVIDYRNAQAAIDLFNRGSQGRDTLMQHPHLADMLLELTRAQQPAATLDDVLRDMSTRNGHEEVHDR